MSMEKLQPVGDDCFGDGFLNKKYGQRLVDLGNAIINGKVSLPTSKDGSGKIIVEKNQLIVDLTKMKLFHLPDYPKDDGLYAFTVKINGSDAPLLAWTGTSSDCPS